MGGFGRKWSRADSYDFRRAYAAVMIPITEA